jgi:predicted enzyme related to lactoylglutathione lyase
MTNPVVHFEIISSDGPALEKFYSELFGWHTESLEVPDGSGTYGMIDTHAGKGINGGIATAPEGVPSYVTIYAEGPDLNALLDKAESLGAKTMMPETQMGDMVTIAMFTDPQGNIIGLVKSSDQEAPGVSAGKNVPIDWFEILGPDGKALRKFYRDLFGWEITESMGEFDYGEVHAEKGIGGGIGTSPTGGPMTTVYAHVEDLDKYIARAEKLGGKKLMGPMDAGETVSIAQIADPQGNVFGLYKSKE